MSVWRVTFRRVDDDDQTVTVRAESREKAVRLAEMQFGRSWWVARAEREAG